MRDHPQGVIVLVLDSLRADHVAADRTPFLVELSARSTVFERAIAPAAWTLPSHASMLTGLSPTEHLIRSTGGIRESLLAARRGVDALVEADRFLPVWLEARGVRTFLGSSIGWLSPASGLSTGFDTVDFVPFPPGRRNQSRPPAAQPQVPAPAPRALQRIVPVPVKHVVRTGLELVREGRRALPMAKWVMSGEDKGAARLEAGLAAWLSNIDGSPFFAMVNLIETHDPHIAPKGFGRRDWRSVKATVGVKRFTRRTNMHNWGYSQLPGSEIQRLKDAYRAQASYADRCVQRIVGQLELLGLLESVTVIVTADHGEGFGEHGLLGHGIPLTESVLHVPLIVFTSSRTAGRVSEPVSLSAIASSVAVELVGEPGPFGLPTLVHEEGRGNARSEVEAPGRYFHSSGFKLKEAPAEMDRPAAAFYSGALKLIVGSFWGEALYDLDSDPTETRNLIGEREIPAALAEARTLWERRTGLA